MQDLNDKYSGIYQDRDPIQDRRVNEMDDRLVKAEQAIQALKKGMDDGVTQLEYEKLYKSVKSSLEEVGEGILALKKEIDNYGNKITENSARIDVTANLIRLSVEASERDTLSKALEESKAMFEVLAGQITSEVTQKRLDEMGMEIYNMKSSIIQTAESITQIVSKEQVKINGKIEEMSTSIFQSAQEIVLLANRVSETETGILNNSSQIQLLADEIALSVTRSEFDLLGLEVSTNKSNIQLLSDEINLSVKQDIFDLGVRMSTAESTIALLPGEIELRVKTVDYNGANIVSLINLQPDTVKIQAKNINLLGSVTFYDLDSSVTDKLLEGELAQDYVTNVLPGILDDISTALDGLTEQHFETYDPTTSNLPASDWTTPEMKEAHLGDLFYNTSNGKSFRWVREGGVFSWQEIVNSDLQAALDAASKAQDTADSKRRVFTVTPFVPYDVGDMWSGGPTGDLKRAVVARAVGDSYNPADWVLASKYTDNTRAIEAENNAKAYADGMKVIIDGDINNVNTALGNLNTTINTTFKDGVINSAEALAIKSNIDILNTERTEFFSKYNSLYTNIQLTGSAKTNLLSAWNAYDTAHTNLVNAITTSTEDGSITPVEKANVTNKFTEYKNSITTLASRFETAINTIAQAKADDALDKAGINAKNLMDVVPFEGGKKFNNPVSYSYNGGSVTGMLVINTPITDYYMCKVKITGYNYDSYKTDIDLLVDFYSYSNPTIVNYRYVSSGNYLIDNVRLARDSSGRMVILVQNVGSVWDYPKIQVEWAIVSYTTPPDTFKNGWSMSIVNSLPPGLVNLLSVPGVDSQSYAVNLYNKTGIGTLPSGKTIITGGKITTDLLIASEIQSTVVTAAYINSLNIVAGSIKAGSLTIGAFTPAQQEEFNDTKTTANETKILAEKLEAKTGNLVKNPAVTGNTSGWEPSVPPGKPPGNYPSTYLITESVVFGGEVTTAFKSVVNGNAAYYSEWFEVDPSKAYEVTMWFKKSQTPSSTYLGLDALNSVGSNIGVIPVNNADGGVSGVNTNFYFWYTTYYPALNDWYKVTAYILPAGFTPSEAKGIGVNASAHAIMLPNTTVIRIRWLNFYTTGVSTLWVTNPKVVEVDSNAIGRISKNDTTVRSDLRLTSPLPSVVTLDSSGVTARLAWDYSKYANLGGNGLLVVGGALDIRTGTSSNSGVQINASGITGYDTVGNQSFNLNSATGKVTMRGADVEGHINATSGKVGGFNISNGFLEASTEYGIRIMNPYFTVGLGNVFSAASGLQAAGVFHQYSGGESIGLHVHAQYGSIRNLAIKITKGHIHLTDCLEEGATPGYAPKASGHIRWRLENGRRYLILSDAYLFPE